MITGTVISLTATIEVTLRSPIHSDTRIECVIDTGFEGAIAIPVAIVTKLGLTYYQGIYADLADNSDVAVDAYRATVVWDGRDVDVAALALGNRPTIGTALLAGCKLVAHFVDNGHVSVDEV